MTMINEEETHEYIDYDEAQPLKGNKPDESLAPASPPPPIAEYLTSRKKRSMQDPFTVIKKAFAIFTHAEDKTAPATISPSVHKLAEEKEPNVSSDSPLSASTLSVTSSAAEDNTNLNITSRPQLIAGSSPPAAVILSEDELEKTAPHILSPTRFNSGKTPSALSTHATESIKVKILLTPIDNEEMGFQTILRSVPDSPEDMPLKTSQIVHDTIPRGDDSIFRFLNLTKERSDIKKIDLVAPITSTEEDSLILLKTVTNDDIQEMNTQHIELASFISDAVNIAMPLLAQVGIIAIIIYTSRAKLAQFYAKFGEAAHATLASALVPYKRAASETTTPAGAPPTSSVTRSDSQDSEYTLGSESSDELMDTAAIGIGAGIAAAAAGRLVARAEDELAAAMEVAFEDLVDNMVVLAAAAA